MSKDSVIRLAQARDLTRDAARWLVLLRFQVHGAAPTFGPSMSLYHDLLDPAVLDASRLNAARAIHTHVEHQAQVEQVKGEMRYVRDRPVDPYRLEWRTTKRGACLETVSTMLSKAIRLYEVSLDGGRE